MSNKYAEFLETLKEYINDAINSYETCPIDKDDLIGLKIEIERFEAELKQVDNEQ